MPRIDEAFVMSQKVVGLKRLCDKYKLSKKGRKAELQKTILKHLKLGEWTEETGETSLETTKDGGTNCNTPQETANEEALPMKTVIAGGASASTKLEQYKEMASNGETLMLDKPEEEGLKEKTTEEDVLVIQLDQPPTNDDKETMVSDEEEVNPFAGMQPLPLFPRDDNVESGMKRSAEKAGMFVDQKSTKKQRLEAGTSQPSMTPPSFPPFYKDKWVPVGGNKIASPQADLKVTPSPEKADLPKYNSNETNPIEHENPGAMVPDVVKTLWELGQTKAEIEEFLNRHTPKELVELCMEFCAVDPELLPAMSQENGKSQGHQQLSLRKILIYGLNTELTTARDLELAFSKHGLVSESFVARDATGRSKGYGFVTMSTIAEAGNALENAPRLLDGWPTRCTLATTRRK